MKKKPESTKEAFDRLFNTISDFVTAISAGLGVSRSFARIMVMIFFYFVVKIIVSLIFALLGIE